MCIRDRNEIEDNLPHGMYDKNMEILDYGVRVLTADIEKQGREYVYYETLHVQAVSYTHLNMLKTVLFGFMDTGYASLRELEDRCKVNIRYMYLMDHETPSYRAFSYFIFHELLPAL